MRNLGQQWELGTTSCAAPPSLPWSHWGIGQLILIPLLICKVLWLMSDRGWKSLSWRAGLSLHLVPLTWMPSRWAWVNQCLLSRGPQVLSLLVLLSPERWVSFLTAISWWVLFLSDLVRNLMIFERSAMMYEYILLSSILCFQGQFSLLFLPLFWGGRINGLLAHVWMWLMIWSCFL